MLFFLPSFTFPCKIYTPRRKETVHLKEGEDQKTKTYTALCVTPSPYDAAAVKAKLDSMKDVPLEQRTPLRVLHRRPNAVRKRTVYFMEVRLNHATSQKNALYFRIFR